MHPLSNDQKFATILQSYSLVGSLYLCSSVIMDSILVVRILQPYPVEQFCRYEVVTIFLSLIFASLSRRSGFEAVLFDMVYHPCSSLSMHSIPVIKICNHILDHIHETVFRGNRLATNFSSPTFASLFCRSGYEAVLLDKVFHPCSRMNMRPISVFRILQPKSVDQFCRYIVVTVFSCLLFVSVDQNFAAVLPSGSLQPCSNLSMPPIPLDHTFAQIL